MVEKCFGEWFICKDLEVCGYKIEDGFISNGISSPVAKSHLNSKPQYLYPSILHDYLYYTKQGFFKSNKIFYKALREYKVNCFISLILCMSVTLFGYIFYKGGTYAKTNTK